MGLDTTHGCWHGAYSAFHRWRVEVAKAAGIPLELMEGHWGYSPYQKDISEIVAKHATPGAFSPDPGGGFVATRESLMTSLSAVMAKDQDLVAMQAVLEDILPYLPLKWESLRPDPIHILLYHSDCDGSIASADCGPIADSLKKLLPKLEGDKEWHEEKDDDGGEWKLSSRTLANDMARNVADETGRPVRVTMVTTRREFMSLIGPRKEVKRD